MIELEKTYLAKKLPQDLEGVTQSEIIDIYWPQESEHPVLRLRKKGKKYELTKKQPVDENDVSKQLEQTIILDQEEFKALRKLPGKVVSKIRYQYPYEDVVLEFDIFQEDLAGLVVIDVEFQNEQDKDSFKMPDFCLTEVTQERFIAGGMLCGKNYRQIKGELDRLDYKKLAL